MVSLLCPSSFTRSLFFRTMVCLVLLLNLTYTQPLCHDEERIALVQFNKTFLITKPASVDPSAYPKVALWISNDCCSWDGVECDKNTGHVIGLDLSSSYLYGPMNSWSSLFQLFHLRRLNLADNDFSFSEIPYKVGHFSQLTLLNLSHSGFYGQVPSDITRLCTLTTLDLGRNWLQLQRSDFGWLLRNMKSLQKLVLRNVSISSNLPPILANLTSLTHVDFSHCNLFGSIPSSLFLGNLTKLSFLSLDRNRFSGPIPSSLGDLAQLKYLDLSQNNFTPGDLSLLGKQTKLAELYLQNVNLVGDIASSLFNLTHLQKLVLSGNKLIGELPYEISNLTKLVVLDLGFNNMHGPIPNSISKLVNLEWLSLGPNNFTGTVKFDIFFGLTYLNSLLLDGGNLSLVIETDKNATHLPKFHILSLQGCNLREFPYFLRYQDELEYLSLAENKLQGHIPNWIGNLSRETLYKLDLSVNILTGFEQSSVFSSLVSLKVLELSYNKLEGPIPSLPTSILEFFARNNLLMGRLPQSICNLNSLLAFDLSHNNLAGSIPPCLGNLNDSLTVLRLRNNSFRGNIPATLANLANLRLIDLSSNQLHGPSPRSLANCQMLQAIDLGENHISGRFPFWLGDLPKLEVLMLRSNHLSGEIRALETLSGLSKLRILDLSFNNFTGVLPNEFFSNLSSMQSIKVDHLEYLAAKYTKKLQDSKFHFSCLFEIGLANKGNQIQYQGSQISWQLLISQAIDSMVTFLLPLRV